MRMSQWAAFGFVLVLMVAVGASGGFAQYDYGTPTRSVGGLQDELKTAMTHAGFAQKYETLQEVRTHLHHVLNCLVGPKDKMFDAAAGNPCQGQGGGIVADIPASNKDALYEARWSAHIADEALTMKTLEENKAGAHIVALALADLQKIVK